MRLRSSTLGSIILPLLIQYGTIVSAVTFIRVFLDILKFIRVFLLRSLEKMPQEGHKLRGEGNGVKM